VFLILLITRTLSKHDNDLKLEKFPKISLQEKAKQNVSDTIEGILNNERQRLMEIMRNHPERNFGVNAKNLTELTLQGNSNPIRSVIISSWRSGSTFLGDVINALPGNFYYYEPLIHFNIKKIRGEPSARAAVVNLLKNLLTCNYTETDEYKKYSLSHEKNEYFSTYNKPLWAQCQLFPNFCHQPKLLEKFCKLFPMQSMKVLKLSLRPAADLLKDLR
jgi:hypothetical protein